MDYAVGGFYTYLTSEYSAKELADAEVGLFSSVRAWLLCV